MLRSRPAWPVVAVGLIALVLALALRAGIPPAGPAPGDRPIVRVLFIGNSLTAGNDLPAMVAAISRASPDGPVIEGHALVAGGASLSDQWPRARQRIAEGTWTWVVLQQGPSALPESREALLADARRYARAIREAGGKPAFYMVWPSKQRSGDFPRVVESYRLAAESVEGRILPAGEAWQAALRRDADLPLYGPDDFHASPQGTWLAALVIYAGLAERSPLEAPPPSAIDDEAVRRVRLTDEAARLLAESAAAVLGAGATRPAAGANGRGADPGS